MDISLTNGAHFEWEVIQYIVSKIFPEFPIHTIRDKPHSASKYNLGFSGCLDGKVLNGKWKTVNGRRDLCFSLDEKATIPYIIFTGEPYDVHVESQTGNHRYLIISSLKKHEPEKNIFKICFGYFWYIRFFTYNYEKYFKKFRETTCSPEYFLGYCASRKTKSRKDFFERFILIINKPEEVVCFGKDNSYNCVVKQLEKKQPSNYSLVENYHKCKFVMCFENCILDGYLTEKILTVFVSGAIPIYWGDHNYAKSIFNPKSFICVNDFGTFEECINYIISMSEEEIQIMKNEPMFVNNVVPDVFNIESSFFDEFRTQVREMVLNT